MSGGTWDYLYASGDLEELADELRRVLAYVRECERIVDWSEAGDSSRSSAEHDLYEHWVRAFCALSRVEGL